MPAETNLDLPDELLEIPDESQELLGNQPYLQKNYGPKNSTDFLIDIINKLEDILIFSGEKLDIPLPEIVVIGSQSAGKSSVLENMVEKEFLPRGNDVVTRRPTIVRLHPSEEEYFTFKHKPNVKYTNFQDVIREIKEETDRDPGPNEFSSEPIYVNIYSQNVLKLTVVDMPGLIRNVVGDQSESSVETVRSMVAERLANADAIIVAVTPANQDLATSEALEIAQQADPDRERTLGVLTKLDLMDEGTDARDVLENKKIPLKKGYVGVINRSQKEIYEGKDMAYLREKEKNFFENHKSYKYMAHRMGCGYLQQKLSEMLKKHVQKCLPDIKLKLQKKLSDLQKDLSSYDSLITSVDERTGAKFHMMRLVQIFIEEYDTSIHGQRDNVSMEEISAGAHIFQMFYRQLESNLQLPRIPSEQELNIIIANINGIKNAFTLPSLALDTAVKAVLETYEAPIKTFIHNVAEVLVTNAQDISNKIIKYPLLRRTLLVLVNAAVTEASEKTKKRLAEFLDADRAYVYYPKDFHVFTQEDAITEIADAASPDNSRTSVKDKKGGKKKNCYSKVELSALRVMIQEYLQTQRKDTIKMCVKYIVYFLIEKVLYFNKFQLVPSIEISKNYEELIKECEEDFKIVHHLEDQITKVKEALGAIQTF